VPCAESSIGRRAGIAANDIQLAKRELANRVLWIAEAESWSRQSNENFAASQSNIKQPTARLSSPK
jgi:hypothetical protein